MIEKTFYTVVVVLSLFLASSCGKVTNDGKTGSDSHFMVHALAAPTAPTGISAVADGDRIIVKWIASHGATSYTVYYSDKPGAARVQGEMISSITTTSFEHTGIKQNTTYYYVVTASNESGESPSSAESGAMVQAVPLQAPTNVAASGGDGKIKVKWNAVPRASSYTLYYATNPGIARVKGKKIGGVKSAPHQLAGVKKNTMYFFVVTAVNNAGEGPASTETGAMP